MEISHKKIDELEKEINFLWDALQVNQEILSKTKEIFLTWLKSRLKINSLKFSKTISFLRDSF